MSHVVELSPEELQDLFDKIYAAERSGGIKEVKCTLPKQKRLSLVSTRRDRLMAIALLKLRYGKNIPEILKEEYESISSPALRDLYANIVILDAMGIATPRHHRTRYLMAQSVEPGAARAMASLFDQQEDGFHVRHPVLVAPLLKTIFPEVADRSLALIRIVRSLNLKNAGDREFWLHFATSQAIGRRIFRLFATKKEVMRSFIDEIRLLETEFLASGLAASFFGLLGTIYKDVLFEFDSAFAQFIKSYEADEHNPYVVRQLAWTTLKLGEMREAEAYCREAVVKWSDDSQTLSEAAFIMSWCSREGFNDANDLYKQAVELDPTDKDTLRKWDRYREAATINRFFVGSELPDTVLEEIGAPSFIWRVRRHAKKQYSRALFRELSGSLRKENFDLEEIDELVSAAKGASDKKLSGLVQANIARASYERWYRFGEEIEQGEVKRRFQTAIEKCPNDAFIHCWYGTFLKEVELHYDGAEYEYETARTIARASRADYIIEHPMILNNIALLIMDGVYRQLRGPEQLTQAYKVLSEAVQRMIETSSEFHWPVNSMESLKLQAVEFGIELPKD